MPPARTGQVLGEGRGDSGDRRASDAAGIASSEAASIAAAHRGVGRSSVPFGHRVTTSDLLLHRASIHAAQYACYDVNALNQWPATRSRFPWLIAVAQPSKQDIWRQQLRGDGPLCRLSVGSLTSLEYDGTGLRRTALRPLRPLPPALLPIQSLSRSATPAQPTTTLRSPALARCSHHLLASMFTLRAPPPPLTPPYDLR